MPYIKQSDRKELAEDPNRDIENEGELNYVITEMIFHYFKKKPNYKSINAIVGALESAKLEFYRRVAGPYEDKKIKENGDVY
jgi:hypothetical protein